MNRNTAALWAAEGACALGAETRPPRRVLAIEPRVTVRTAPAEVLATGSAAGAMLITTGGGSTVAFASGVLGEGDVSGAATVVDVRGAIGAATISTEDAEATMDGRYEPLP